MGKRRKLSHTQKIMLRTAARDGFKTYRYGSPTPVSVPRIFTGQKRQHMVSQVMDMLRDWRSSAFEHEGAARAGVRSGLCLDGHGWRQAENEAEALIAEALHLMGAKRPTREEGQREYPIGQDYCQYCRGPLDEEDIAFHRKFCSTDCASRYMCTRDDDVAINAEHIRRNAYYLVRTKRFAPKPCAWCGTTFQPSVPDAETCSTACRESLHISRLPKRECERCGTSFQPRKHHQKFCSTDCTIAAQTAKKSAMLARERGERSCKHCLTVFRPKRSDQFYCSTRCTSRASAKAHKLRQKAKREEAKASAFICEEVKEAA